MRGAGGHDTLDGSKEAPLRGLARHDRRPYWDL